MVKSPLGKKRRVLRSSEPCYQDCWRTGLLHASLIGSNPHRHKSQRGWAPSRRTAQSVHESISSSIDITVQNTQRQFCYSTPASGPTLRLRFAHKEATRVIADICRGAS